MKFGCCFDKSDFEYLIEGESEVSKIKEKLIDNNLSINPFSKNVQYVVSFQYICVFYELKRHNYKKNGVTLYIL